MWSSLITTCDSPDPSHTQHKPPTNNLTKSLHGHDTRKAIEPKLPRLSFAQPRLPHLRQCNRSTQPSLFDRIHGLQGAAFRWARTTETEWSCAAVLLLWPRGTRSETRNERHRVRKGWREVSLDRDVTAVTVSGTVCRTHE